MFHILAIYQHKRQSSSAFPQLKTMNLECPAFEKLCTTSIYLMHMVLC